MGTNLFDHGMKDKIENCKACRSKKASQSAKVPWLRNTDTQKDLLVGEGEATKS